MTQIIPTLVPFMASLHIHLVILFTNNVFYYLLPSSFLRGNDDFQLAIVQQPYVLWTLLPLLAILFS